MTVSLSLGPSAVEVVREEAHGLLTGNGPTDGA